jgi:hypothetical protein
LIRLIYSAHAPPDQLFRLAEDEQQQRELSDQQRVLMDDLNVQPGEVRSVDICYFLYFLITIICNENFIYNKNILKKLLINKLFIVEKD